MNEFIKEKTIEALKKAHTSEFKDYLIKQAEVLDSLDVKNEQDLAKYHYLSQLIPVCSKRIFGYINKSACEKIMDYVYKQDISSTQEAEEKIAEAFCKKIVKVAYPNVGVGQVDFPQYNMAKWTNAINDIYIRTRIFGNKEEAIKYVTKDWSDMDELLNFKGWFKFYDDGGLNLYKSSQLTPSMIPGLIRGDTPKPQQPEIKRPDPTMEEALQDIKRQILGRIQSAKKLLSTNKGQLFAGDQYRSLYRMLLDLEQDIAVIKTASGLEDIIDRARNGLIYKGCNDTTINVFNKIAQTLPTEIGGAPPAADPNAPAAPAAPPAGNGKDAIEQFTQNLREGISGTENVEKEEEPEEKKASYKWWESEASIVNLTKVAKKLEETIKELLTITSLTKVASIIKIADDVKSIKLQDDVIDRALDGIKLKDVIDRLEALSKVFKNREIARQLFIIDLMLDKLGISGFFPQLAEATKSALESNQYAQNRIEEVLSKLLSATDDVGRSLITKTPVKGDSFVDKEMEGYLNPKEVVAPKKEEVKQEGEVAPAPPATIPVTPEAKVEKEEAVKPTQPPAVKPI